MCALGCLHKADSRWEALVERPRGLIIMYSVSAVGTFAACTLPMSQLHLESAFSTSLLRKYEMVQSDWSMWHAGAQAKLTFGVTGTPYMKP